MCLICMAFWEALGVCNILPQGVGTVSAIAETFLGNHRAYLHAQPLLLELLGHPKKSSNFFVQNGACLVGKILAPLVGVFCTHLEPPNCHIWQTSKFSRFWGFLDFPENNSSKVNPSCGWIKLRTHN